MNKIEIITLVGTLAFVWIMLSGSASAVKSISGKCGSKLPVDSVLYTEMLCEVG